MAKKKAGGNEVEEGKVCAILLYLVWIVGIIWYFADDKMRKNKFANYHAKQSIVLVITAVALSIGLSILAAILIWIPFIGWALISLLWIAFWIIMLIFVILGIINSVNGAQKPLPIIGQFAKNFKF
jgi:uncharacterized membrane protein